MLKCRPGEEPEIRSSSESAIDRLSVRRFSRRQLLQMSTLLLSGVLRRGALWADSGILAKNIVSGSQLLRFGLNYVPRKNWWYIWQDWDAQSVAADLYAIRDLGMDHIRIQCLWPVFQPGINFVNHAALDRLSELLDLAAKADLSVQVTVLNGWLSGFAYLPSWVAPLQKFDNIFTSEEVIEAEQLLFRAIAGRIRQHPQFLGFDLGNEIDVVQDIEGNQVSLEAADRWARNMLIELERIAPGKFHVNGVDHRPWFQDKGFSRHALATTGSATVIHCYAYWSGALQRYRYDDAGNLHLLEYMVELAKAFHQSPDRPVWVEEVGTSSEWMPEQYLEEYTTRLLTNAVECGHLWGITWWCSHDIDPAIKGFDKLEYGLGVLDCKNHVKPIGRTLAKLVKEWRRYPPQQLKRSVALVIPETAFPCKDGDKVWTIPDRFMELIRQNRRPAIVLESRATDEQYLQARGIEDLVRL